MVPPHFKAPRNAKIFVSLSSLSLMIRSNPALKCPPAVELWPAKGGIVRRMVVVVGVRWCGARLGTVGGSDVRGGLGRNGKVFVAILC